MLSLDELREWATGARARGQRVALCHGCFDLLHYGHLLHFTAARGLADRLVVTLTADRFIDKGPDRPVFDERRRAEMVDALRVVDAVAVNYAPTAVPVIAAVHPDVYVKGRDYAGGEDPALLAELAALDAVGGRVHFTDTPMWSSTSLLAHLHLAGAPQGPQW